MEVGRFIVPKVILKRRDDVKLCTIVAPGCAKCTKMQTIICDYIQKKWGRKNILTKMRYKSTI